jgi:hypothetical protein
VGKNVGRERKVRRRKKCEKKKREEKIGESGTRDR